MTSSEWDEIYRTYHDRVMGYIAARVQRREDAEDLCADVFAKVLKGLDRYDPEKASISTWIYQITRFTYIDHLRKKRPDEPLCEEIAEADDIEEAFIKKDTLKRLAFALQTLKREERDIVVLRYYKGLSLTEISRLTGISYGMVKVRHVSALAALRDLLGSGE